MDAEKRFRVQLLFELRDGVIDTIRVAFRYGECHLLFCVEMRDPRQLEKPQSVSQPRSNAIGILRMVLAKRIGQTPEQRLEMLL
jgi:hypothetical protein